MIDNRDDDTSNNPADAGPAAVTGIGVTPKNTPEISDRSTTVGEPSGKIDNSLESLPTRVDTKSPPSSSETPNIFSNTNISLESLPATIPSSEKASNPLPMDLHYTEANNQRLRSRFERIGDFITNKSSILSQRKYDEKLRILTNDGEEVVFDNVTREIALLNYSINDAIRSRLFPLAKAALILAVANAGLLIFTNNGIVLMLGHASVTALLTIGAGLLFLIPHGAKADRINEIAKSLNLFVIGDGKGNILVWTRNGVQKGYFQIIKMIGSM